MSYGRWLDQAAAALRNARQDVATSSAGGHVAASAAVAQRARLYRGLARLAELIGNPVVVEPTAARADRLIHSARSLRVAGPATVLFTGLRVSAAADLLPVRSPAAPGHPVAQSLGRAADSLAVAGDILASHVGTRARRPRTLEGRAIAVGVGTDRGLAEVADLALLATATDRLLPAWLVGPANPSTLEPLYQPVVDRVRWWISSGYPRALQNIAAAASGGSVLRPLDVAPATETSTGPRTVASFADVAEVMETGQAWMSQNLAATGLRHVSAAIRLAVTVAAAANRLAPRPNQRGSPTMLVHWSTLAQSLPQLADIHNASHPVAAELAYAADWLRTQVLAAINQAAVAADHDVWTARGGLGPNRQRTYAAIINGARTTAEIATQTGYHRNTVRNHLAALERHQLVQTAVTGAVRVGPAALDDVAKRLGVAGTQARQRLEMTASPGSLAALVDRLPGLATVLHMAASAAVTRGQWLVQSASPHPNWVPRGGIFYAEAHWEPATLDHPGIDGWLTQLRGAASAPAAAGLNLLRTAALTSGASAQTPTVAETTRASLAVPPPKAAQGLEVGDAPDTMSERPRAPAAAVQVLLDQASDVARRVRDTSSKIDATRSSDWARQPGDASDDARAQELEPPAIDLPVEQPGRELGE